MFNPEIVVATGGRFIGREACLSRPGKSVKVRRHKKVTVVYTNVDGEVITSKFTKFTARIIQHEVDHLDGKYI